MTKTIIEQAANKAIIEWIEYNKKNPTNSNDCPCLTTVAKEALRLFADETEGKVLKERLAETRLCEWLKLKKQEGIE